MLVFGFGDFKPFEYVENGRIKGANVEILEAVSKKLGIEIRLVAYPWARCIYLVRHGMLDGVMSLYRSSERETYLYYPDEHINIDECVFFTFPGSNVHFDGNLASMTGKTILIAQANSYGDEFDRSTNFKKALAPNTVNVVRMIAAKRYTIGIGSRKSIEAEVRANGYENRIEILDAPYIIKTYFAFSKKKDNAFKGLADDFSHALKAFKTTPKYEAILKKYGCISW